MSTPSTQPTKTASSAGGKTTTTTTVVKKTTTTTTSAAAKQLQQKKVGAGSKTKTASGKKVINAHHNAPLASEGLMRFSRGRMFHRRALYRLSKWKGEHAKLKETETATGKTKKTAGSIQKKKQRPQALKKKPIGGERNGKERLVRTKRYPRYYPTEERPKKFSVKRKTFSSHPRRFRSSLAPGTVVILVAGKHAGKRAVVVKHLSSGLLLITGPHKLNGVPLRRMNQIYVIATSTKIDLSSAQVADLDDKFFKRVRKTKKNAETDIFDSKKEKTPLNEERRQAQLNIDTAVLNAIKAQADSRLLRRYLKSRFQLWNGVLPHKLNF